jgi:hypothetical protein
MSMNLGQSPLGSRGRVTRYIWVLAIILAYIRSSLEIRDLFDDLLGQNSYTGMIVNAYNEGLNNFLRTPSLNSVKQVKSIVSSAITRIEENPGLIKQSEETNPPQSVATQTALELPERVTLHWLYKNVPYRFWLGMGSLLITAFVLGATAAIKLPAIQQWFGVACSSAAG